jgi:8-oxo-dGTP diphosphatase
VVAAAILRDARVLVARRRLPSALAGGWEFPGGKVEPGEQERAALARECREELGIDVVVGARLGEAADAHIVLTLFAARVEVGEPAVHHDHDALRWLTAAQLDDVPWLPIDRELLAAVADELT